MFPRKPTKLIVAALSFCIVFTSLAPVAFAQKKTAPVEATPPPLTNNSKFGDARFGGAEQADLLDTKFERDGLVLATKPRTRICVASGNR
jgi:hypothetical protein